MTEHEQSAAAQKIARESPEGVPASPGFRKRHFVSLLAMYLLVLAGLSVALAGFVGVQLGLLVGGLGLVLVCMNPAIWTGLVRSKEREAILDRG